MFVERTPSTRDDLWVLHLDGPARRAEPWLRGEADEAKSIYAFQQGLKGAARFKQVQLHGITPPSGKQAHTGFSVTVALGEEAP